MRVEALVACAGVTLAAVSTALGIELRSGWSPRMATWTSRHARDRPRRPVGLRSIRLTFELDTDAADGDVDTLISLPERDCVVSQAIASGTPLEITRTRPGRVPGALGRPRQRTSLKVLVDLLPSAVFNTSEAVRILPFARSF